MSDVLVFVNGDISFSFSQGSYSLSHLDILLPNMGLECYDHSEIW